MKESHLVRIRDSKLSWPIQRVLGKLGISIVANSSNLDFQLKYYIENYNLEYCLDIGAHHGEFINRLDRLNCNLETTCYEASSSAYKILHKKFGNQVNAENFAITHEKGKFELFESGSVFASLKRRKNKNDEIEGEFVHGITLDDAAEALGKDRWGRTLLKVDVQGSELEVFRSGKKFLKNCPVVVTEAPLREFYQNAYKFEDLVVYMSKLDFVIGAIHTPRFFAGKPIDCDVIFVRDLSFQISE